MKKEFYYPPQSQTEVLLGAQLICSSGTPSGNEDVSENTSFTPIWIVVEH